MSLSTDELMLLNNLIYLQEKSIYNPWGRELQVIDDCFEGKTVGEFLNSIVVDTARSNDNRAFISGQEWSETVRAIQSNPELMNMVIKEGQKDTASGGGEGESVLLVNPSSNEAVMVFRGTADREWYDDFYGGGPTTTFDRVSTPQQINARDWFNKMYNKYDLEQYDVIVTGHSKGGNKAKYITLLEGSAKVDKCVSFDGQGFSEEFIQRYGNAISQYEGLIENHNVDYDFVNLLLHDVGDRYFYKSQNITGFAEYHSPNSFFEVEPNGDLYYKCIGNTAPQPMPIVGDFFNRILDNLPVGMKSEGLAFLGKIFEAGWNIKWNGLDMTPLYEAISDVANRNILNEILKTVEMEEIISVLEDFLSGFGIDLPDNIMDALYGMCDIIDRSIPMSGDYDIQEKNNFDSNREIFKNLAEGLALGGAAGVAGVATAAAINAKNSEEEHIVHDHLYYGPLVEEPDNSEQFVAGMNDLAEAGTPEEEYEEKNDFVYIHNGLGAFDDSEITIEENETNIHTGGVYYINGDSDVINLEPSDYEGEDMIAGAALQGITPIIQDQTEAAFHDNSDGFDGIGFGGADNFDGLDFSTYMQTSALVSGFSTLGAIGGSVVGKNKKEFLILPKNVKLASDKIYSAKDNLNNAKAKLEKISMNGSINQHIQKALDPIRSKVHQESTECNNLGKCLYDIQELYLKNERELLGGKPSLSEHAKEGAKPLPHNITKAIT